ncbi:hypothetical protein [Halocella sp. SP3-1]|uniref:hypothetical protein n=1 Tax=Halocella sp. SP3-1 TaxID=2382161 RepID=UPI000F7638BD|nr:hypothetical protein [Halocella sp. SP3-1]AZO96580.1 hypothetical protein D7D81_19375 [Halocella sp. SP3-1]
MLSEQGLGVSKINFKNPLTGNDRDVKIYLVAAKSGKELELISRYDKKLFMKKLLDSNRQR